MEINKSYHHVSLRNFENEQGCNIIIISEIEDQDVYEEEENQEDASSIE